MRVSVIVPLYNKVKYISRALRSIAGQTFRDFEIIVIDDGSSDGSGELAAGFPDRRLRVIRQENAGPGAARNHGIAEAQGDLLAFLDADDAWLPAYLERSVAAFDRAGIQLDAVACGYLEIPGYVANLTLWSERGIHQGIQCLTPATSGRMLQHMVAFMTASGTVATRQAVTRWGGFAQGRGCTYGEDAALWLKILLNGNVWFEMHPLLIIDRDASELCGNFRAPRPIEAFLDDPSDLERSCPAALIPALRRFLSYRSCKTAAAVGYCGNWRGARSLVRDYVQLRDVGALHFLAALTAGTPAAPMLGKLLPGIGAGQSRKPSFWERLA